MSTSIATVKSVKIPGPDHPITIEKSISRVIVIVAGKRVADSKNVLTLREGRYQDVFYIPREDVNMTLLERTDHETYCPYKGDCNFFSIPAGGERSINAVWTYEAPFEAVELIKNLVAFYPDRVDSLEEIND